MFVLHLLLTEMSVKSQRPLSSVTWASYCASPPFLSLCSMFRGVRAAKVLHEVDFSTLTCVCACLCEKQIMRVSLCICVPTASSPLLPKSCHLLYPRILCSKQRPLIHPDNLLTLPLLLFFPTRSQTYQQSSSLQSKSRKKNKGKQRRHLFELPPQSNTSQLWLITHSLSLMDAEILLLQFKF